MEIQIQLSLLLFVLRVGKKMYETLDSKLYIERLHRMSLLS